jgi:phosphate-selective porin
MAIAFGDAGSNSVKSATSLTATVTINGGNTVIKGRRYKRMQQARRLVAADFSGPVLIFTFR